MGLCTTQRFVQELCAGGSLARFLAAGLLRRPGGGLAWPRALLLLRDAAAGLAHAHARGAGAPPCLPARRIVHKKGCTSRRHAE